MMDFESPIEEQLYFALQYELAPTSELRSQVPVETDNGSFRLDFLLTVRGHKIGIECDGKHFHEHERDARRDQAILASGGADEIIRFRGRDIFLRAKTCAYVLSEWHPDAFTDRARESLRRLVTESVRIAVDEGDLKDSGFLCWPGSRMFDVMTVSRLCRHMGQAESDTHGRLVEISDRWDRLAEINAQSSNPCQRVTAELVDRLCDHATVIHCNWPSYRKAK